MVPAQSQVMRPLQKIVSFGEASKYLHAAYNGNQLVSRMYEVGYRGEQEVAGGVFVQWDCDGAVSYTHLTLPTILLV
eukprot:331030-Pleurochrysis_carterae.AAC.1